MQNNKKTCCIFCEICVSEDSLFVEGESSKNSTLFTCQVNNFNFFNDFSEKI